MSLEDMLVRSLGTLKTLRLIKLNLLHCFKKDSVQILNGSDVMSEGLRKAQYKAIEDEIRFYHATKKELEQLRINVVMGSTFQEYPDENIGGGSGGHVSNPTEQRALLLQMDRQIERRQKVILAIESVLNTLSDEDKQLIQFRYWDRSKPTWIWIANRLNMSESTAKRKRNNIIYKIANRLGY